MKLTLKRIFESIVLLTISIFVLCSICFSLLSIDTGFWGIKYKITGVNILSLNRLQVLSDYQLDRTLLIIGKIVIILTIVIGIVLIGLSIFNIFKEESSICHGVTITSFFVALSVMLYGIVLQIAYINQLKANQIESEIENQVQTEIANVFTSAYWPLVMVVIGIVLFYVIHIYMPTIPLTFKSVEEEQETQLDVQQVEGCVVNKNISSSCDELVKIKSLLDAGAISQNEYETIKAKIISKL